MHTRSLASLNIPPLSSFSLEPPALPPSVSFDGRSNSSLNVGAGWAPPPSQQQSLPQQRPDFFEREQQNRTTTFNSQSSATPVMLPLQQFYPPFVPAVGSGDYQFHPWREAYDASTVLHYHSLACRPELMHKSPEELRLEDYAVAGIATLQPSQAGQPGEVATSFGQQQQQQQPQGIFGTSTVGLFPTTPGFGSAQPSAFSLQPPAQSAFAAPQSAFGTQQPSAFQPQQQFQQPQQQSAFGAIPSWGTATAGFGSVFGNDWTQQQSSVFGSLANNSAFQQQQPQQSAFFGQSAQPFNFFSQPATPFQIPQQAEFFFLECPTRTFSQFMAALPPRISSISFGGTQVALPTEEQCARWRREEQQYMAKVDADPFGLGMMQKAAASVEPVLPPLSLEEAAATSTPSSPLKRGTSSPLLAATRSPMLLPVSSRVDSLHPPGSSTPGQGSRSITASLSHSPRLGPLPASPYLEPVSLVGAHGGHSRANSVHSTPTKAPPPHPPHTPSASLCANLFSAASASANLDALTASPHRALATPELKPRAEAQPIFQREMAWASRLIE